MQIGSGQSPLSLAVMKALGVQAPAAPAAPSPVAKPLSQEAAGSARAVAGRGPGEVAAPDLGVAKTIPRGSFVDIKA